MVNYLAVFGFIGAAVAVIFLLKLSGGLDIIISFLGELFGWTREVIGWLMRFKILGVLFILLFLTTLIPMAITFFLQMFYVCDGVSADPPVLMAYNVPVIDGLITLILASDNATVGNTTKQTEHINAHTTAFSQGAVGTEMGIWYLRCLTPGQVTVPKLTLLGIDIFNYRTMLLLIVLMSFVVLTIKVKGG